MRYYELNFITAAGKRIQGPCLPKKEYQKLWDFVQEADKIGDLTLTMNKYRVYFPSAAFKAGHLELRGRGFLYFLWRLMRTR